MADNTFFTHHEIVDVISDVQPWDNFLLNFFGMEHHSQDEKIHFDRIADDRRISVFVNPRRPGQVIKSRGFAVDSYKPGYVKDKRTVDHKHVFNRRPGQPIQSPLSPSERYAATVVDLAAMQVRSLYRRLEWMAAELLLNGTYDMVGDDLNVNVDFARKTENTITLPVAGKWIAANTGVSPIDDIENWLTQISSSCKTILFGQAAWKAFRNDPKFKDALTLESIRGENSGMTFMPQRNGMEDVTYRGTLASVGCKLVTYSGTYDHPVTGDETLFIPEDAVILVSDSSFGYQCFASILDADADYQTMQYFMKNWVEKDPGIPYLLLQSSPMLAHSKINSTLSCRTGAIL